jgi:hypothetical protein
MRAVSIKSPLRRTPIAARVGGWSLVTAAIGFIGVFGYLAARFNYPDVLDGHAAEVLPQLLALGGGGRMVWAFYACLPLLLIPAGIGAHAAWKHAAPNAMNAALVVAVVAALTMFAGLARWPSVHWDLARAYTTATPDARIAIDALFAGLNVYLGNYIGEFVGELFLNAWFVLTGYAALQSAPRGWMGWTGITVGVAGWIGAFRNVTALVGPVAELNNYLLPAWLITLGVVLIRGRYADSGISASVE